MGSDALENNNTGFDNTAKGFQTGAVNRSAIPSKIIIIKNL
jgi:hypothetical protein